MRWCCRLAALLLVGLLPAGRLAAQAPPPAAADSPKPVAGPAVEASSLDTLFLRDSKGNLVPVLGMSFEEFEQLWRMKRGLGGPAAPAYTLDALTLVGSADDGLANFQLTATIHVRQEGWVRVPLLLPTAIIRGESRHEGPGEHYLASDPAGGFICWLKGASGEPHVVTIPLTAGLSTVGEDTRLSLTLPRATESSLRLTLPLSSAEATLTGEGLVSTKSAAGNKTEIAVLGPAGDLQLSWRKGRVAVSKAAAQFDASGEIQVRVESQQSITSTARLRVRSYSGALDVFQVRLPPGMELDIAPAGLTAGYSVTPLAESGPRRPAVGQLVEVRLDKPASGSVEVQIAAAHQPEAGPAAKLVPARFEVVGAVRQRGTIEFSVGGQWQLEWTEDATVRRLDLAADSALGGQVARFEYFKQPCGLQLRVASRPSRVSVEPTHVISVDPQLVRIKSTFKYRFRGARAAGLAFDLGQWKLDSLTPGDLLETPQPITDADAQPGQVRIPFRADAAPAELELTLEAHQPLAVGGTSLQFALPRPLTDVVAPATVVIAPADNIELTPQSLQLVGLTPDPSGVRIPGRQQPPLVYRDLGGGEPATFAAELQVRKRSVIVSGRATARLERQQLQIEQRLEYRIAHEPQREFVLVAPRELTIVNLQVWLGDTLLGVTLLPEPPTPPTPGGPATQRLQVSTAAEQLGPCQLSVRYVQRLPAWDGDKQRRLSVPLVVPADEDGQQFAGQQLDFQAAEGWQIEPDLTGVDEFSRPAALPAAGGPSFTWTTATPLSRWVVSGAANQQGSSSIAKAWIQTWLAPRARHERVAFRLTTNQDALRIQLPRGEFIGGVQAALNGQETPPLTIRETSIVKIELPPALRGREFTLELWYALQVADSGFGLESSRWRPAQVEGAGPSRRTYWQLALPADEHLLAGAGELATEMSWSADRWLLSRQPLLDQRALEQWISASRQDPLPAGAQVYLFGTVGRAANLAAWTIQRRLLLALASGAALVLGLAILYWPVLRQPGALLVLSVALASLGLAEPDLAILVAQGALLGLLVLAGAGLWSWLYGGRTPWPVPVAVSTLTRSTITRPRESPSTQPPVHAEQVPSLSTAAPTAAAPLEAQP